jgi:pyruvate kinase
VDDGVDGILLGQETLRGFFPIESVETLVSIARQAEKLRCLDKSLCSRSSQSFDFYVLLQLAIPAKLMTEWTTTYWARRRCAFLLV